MKQAGLITSRQVRRSREIAYSDVEMEQHQREIGIRNLAKISTHSKLKSRWCSGTCKLCGEHMDVITHYHAGLHGYKRAEDFIKDGNVIFD